MINKRRITIFFIWIVLICNPPFSFYLIERFPHLILKIFSLVVLVFLIIENKKFKISKSLKTIVAILFVNIIFYFFSFFYHIDKTYISLAIPVVYILIIYLAILNIVDVKSFIKSYVVIMCFIGFCGAIAFGLGLIGKVPNLGYIGDPEKRLANYLFTFSNAVFNRDGDFIVIRSAGFFDEPGTLAFYLILALVLNRLSYKSLVYERILIFSGFFTFSLAFFFTLIIYLTFYPNWPKYFLRLGLILVCFFSLVSITKETNSIMGLIDMMTLKRLQTSDDGTIKGDNRTIYFNQGIEFFKEKPLLGHGQQNVLTEYKYFNYDPSSFIGYLVYHGIIGTTIIFLIFLYQFAFLFRYDNEWRLNFFTLKLLALEILLFIQRPLINVPLALILLILIIEIMDFNKREWKLKV